MLRVATLSILLLVGLCASFTSASANEVLVTITCDNTYELYVNGVFIGVQDNEDGPNGWDVPETWVLDLPQGINVIAVHGWDFGGGSAMGLLAHLHGGYTTLVTDATGRLAAPAPLAGPILTTMTRSGSTHSTRGLTTRFPGP